MISCQPEEYTKLLCLSSKTASDRARPVDAEVTVGGMDVEVKVGDAGTGEAVKVLVGGMAVAVAVCEGLAVAVAGTAEAVGVRERTVWVAVADAGSGELVFVSVDRIAVGANVAGRFVLVGKDGLVEVGTTPPIIFPVSVMPAGWAT
jgi:hypothetical protein